MSPSRSPELAPALARLMLLRWQQARREQYLNRPDLILAVPLHATRCWRRGYNQSDLLARPLDVIHQGDMPAGDRHGTGERALQEEGTQIRVFVINPGTPTAECGVSYCPPDAVEATDTELKFDKLSAYVDELSAPYLEDAE